MTSRAAERAARLLALLGALATPMSTAVAGPGSEWQVGGRVRVYGQQTALPAHSALRAAVGTPAGAANADLRSTLHGTAGAWALQIEHELGWAAADGFALTGGRGNDGRRGFDLTDTLWRGADHAVRQRLDRAFVEYRGERLALTAGRTAVSFGNGLVFAPLDLFNPFAPTETDRDYKAGDDLLQAQWLFADGSDVQALAVARRDADGTRSGAAATLGARWHGFAGPAELSVVGVRQGRDRVLGGGVAWPLGGALVRADVVATDLAEGPVRWSWVVNADYGFDVGDTSLYVFAELYRNGFGRDRTAGSVAELDPVLRERIARGEVFVTARDYLALGGRVEWHPLVTQSLLWISNLHDGSAVVQTLVSIDAAQSQRVEVGVTAGLGPRGSEFGGLPLFAPPPGGPVAPLARAPTTAPGTQVFGRWLWYL